MSRIGKRPVTIPSGVTVEVKDGAITVKGPKGELTQALPASLAVTVEGSDVTVEQAQAGGKAHAMHGTIRSLISNMVQGVSQGFTRELEIQGVGFRAQAQGKDLTLSLGYSHPIVYKIPESITVEVKDGTALTVTGVSKQLVGQVSARIRSFYPAEPYKGKGVRYKDEYVRRKAGKAVA